MIESVHTLAALRRHIASLDGVPAQDNAAVRAAIGHGGIDRALGGGLARGRMHELFGVTEEDGAAAGFALLLSRLLGGAAPLLWLRTVAADRAGGHAYGPGLAALGFDPDRLLIALMADDRMLLRGAVDALRCPALGALLIEVRGRAPLLDLTASRRLALAAERSGVTALLLRIGADPVPSAADTRWRIGSAPSRPLPGNAPGMSAFDLSLLKQRAGPDGLCWRLVWNNAAGCFEEDRDARDDAGHPASGLHAVRP
ncbi:MAG: ImuA family protein [Sphingobium sp.]